MADYNDFISAIDNHNVANGDKSWLERKMDASGDFFSDLGEGIAKGLPGAVVAGVDSMLNSGIAALNFLGTDISPIDTHAVLQSLDSNFADYYKEHEKGVETAGFALGMFLPGTAGVKALEAAKAGFLGTNMAKASGLMTTMTKEYANLAKAESAAGNSPFSVLSKSTLQSLAQGAGAAALEMAAFNTAVTVTMYKSPILSDKTVGELFKDDVYDTLIFGGIGAVFKGFKIYGQITKAGEAAELLSYPYRAIAMPRKEAEPVMKILELYESKFKLPEVLGPVPDFQKITGLGQEETLKLLEKERGLTIKRIDELIRENINLLVKGDHALGNQLFEQANKAKKWDEIVHGFLQTKEVGRIGEAESLVYGEALFPDHKLTADQFSNLLKAGDHDLLFSGKAGEGAQGYKVVGNFADLRATSASKDKGISFNREQAFADGYDIFRNTNGTISVNPASKILAPSNVVRKADTNIMDLTTGNIVTKATAGLADLATKDRPVMVRGDTVLAGNLNPIKMGKSEAFNPVAGEYLDAQARYIWAQGAKIKWEGLKIGEFDFPLLERLYKEDANISPGATIKIKSGEAGLADVPRGESLRYYIEQKKHDLAIEMKGKPVDEIALRLNTDEKWLIGGGGESIKLKDGVDYTLPRYAKITVNGDNSMYPMLNANNHQGALEYERRKALLQEKNEQVFHNFAGQEGQLFPDAPNWLDPGRTPTRQGAGASLFGFANANFGSAGGWAQNVATYVDKLLLKRKTSTAETLNTSIASVRLAGEEATAEAALVNNRLLQSDKAWVFHPDGTNTLITKSDFAILRKDPNYKPAETIDIKSVEAAEFFKAHIGINGERQAHVANLKGGAGVGDDFDPSILYPIPVDTTKLKHFVIVKPLAPVSLGDKSRVISAKDEGTLQKLIDQVDQKQFKVITKTEGENWHKAIGDYEYSLGMNQSAVDSTLKREGKLSQHFPTINEGFFDRVMEYHMRQEEILTHSMVYSKYSQPFEELKYLGERYTNVATSQFRSITEKLEQSVKDPYNDIVRTALNISRSSEYQPWINFNSFIKDSIEKPINTLRNIFANTEKIDGAFVDKVNKITTDMGQGNVFQNPTQIMLANGNIPNKPWIQDFVGKLNGILSTTLLQWDTFNAINNVASTAILAAPELSRLREGILKGDAAFVGKLKDLTTVKMPDGSGIELPTVSRILFNAHNDFIKGGDVRAGYVKRFEEINAINTLTQELRQSLGQATLDFSKATAKDADTAIEKMAEFGRKWTGNNIAEQYTRFISAHSAMQIADIGEVAGVISRKEANELITLFTNRTQGNYLYSQRPIVFQGVVGQAVGLFQTYQFNLMQQLFKHVAEGDNKALAMLAGLQGGIYGMQGLPAFNFLNTHIVGNAYGNTDHADLYTASYTTFGKSLGDWIMYGAGSNALGIVDPSMRFNLYSRGDINPRQLSVLPTQLSDIPIVAASTKFISNIFNTFSKIGNGAEINASISQAIEHNGISRPLAGLAQIAQGYTTNNSGALLTAAQDFYGIAQLTRLGGAKPFDESLALDQMYRFSAYHAKDTKDIQELGAAIKTTVVAGKNPTSEQINNFAAEYAKQGGKLEGFNKYFSNMVMQANQSQVNKIANNLQNPMAKNFQVIMGGKEVPDFMNKVP